jgi:hypothetical protein
MKPLLLLTLAAGLLLTSCASTFYSVKAVHATAPLNDNNATSCLLTPDLWPVSAGTLRMMHVRWTQGGATVREDSTSCGAGSVATFPAISVPGAGVVTVTSWASDMGGAGCPVNLTVTPTATTRPPAAPVLSVAP